MNVDAIRAARRPFAALVVVLLATLLALPALAADHPAPGKPDKAAKPAGTPVTLSGVLSSSTDANGKTTYTLTSGGTTYVLGAGPAWFHGDRHPLKPFVGKQVTIDGERRDGTDKVSVTALNGTALREPGKPPWAGGWKKVGEAHPGWTQEKWDRLRDRIKARMDAKGVDCWPPGHCRKAAPAP